MQKYIRLHMFLHVGCFLSPHKMEASCGPLHNGGRVAEGPRPTVVDSIMGAGEAVDIAET